MVEKNFIIPQNLMQTVFCHQVFLINVNDFEKYLSFLREVIDRELGNPVTEIRDLIS